MSRFVLLYYLCVVRGRTLVFFCQQKTAYEMRISDWSSDVCSSDLILKDGYSPVPGLYAIGIDANSIFRGHYPGAGSAIGPAMTFGYIVARELARSKERRGSDDETTKA